MDNRDYIYPIDPDDPSFPEKTSIINLLNESQNRIIEIRRDKENLFLFIATIVISIFIGFYTQERNVLVILWLLVLLLFFIILRLILYREEEDKFVRFFEKMNSLVTSYKLPRVEIK